MSKVTTVGPPLLKKKNHKMVTVLNMVTRTRDLTFVRYHENGRAGRARAKRARAKQAHIIQIALEKIQNDKINSSNITPHLYLKN